MAISTAGVTGNLTHSNSSNHKTNDKQTGGLPVPVPKVRNMRLAASRKLAVVSCRSSSGGRSPRVFGSVVAPGLTKPLAIGLSCDKPAQATNILSECLLLRGMSGPDDAFGSRSGLEGASATPMRPGWKDAMNVVRSKPWSDLGAAGRLGSAAAEALGAAAFLVFFDGGGAACSSARCQVSRGVACSKHRS
ncbi:uncharacterized protein IUM83_19429 [Phytophthora cinnamomi]|uniref:uncharacterized protein n=1 Tax=Phytophthora cinnamomi TaxID=4785 RepID=UPI00355A13DC|nr:hypothetical protein IUM83_19429 [Phytophthora cinnamomi]